jgi:hypothetical protein
MRFFPSHPTSDRTWIRARKPHPAHRATILIIPFGASWWCSWRPPIGDVTDCPSLPSGGHSVSIRRRSARRPRPASSRAVRRKFRHAKGLATRLAGERGCGPVRARQLNLRDTRPDRVAWADRPGRSVTGSKDGAGTALTRRAAGEPSRVSRVPATHVPSQCDRASTAHPKPSRGSPVRSRSRRRGPGLLGGRTFLPTETGDPS